jgi:predicted transcriptional regulator
VILPDDHAGTSDVSLRVPDNVIEAFDRLAAILDQPRSWVMLRALAQYLEDEGAEIFEDVESLAELDRGERLAAEDLRQRTEEIIASTGKPRPRQK